jgi:hypothetical protein
MQQLHGTGRAMMAVVIAETLHRQTSDRFPCQGVETAQKTP